MTDERIEAALRVLDDMNITAPVEIDTPEEHVRYFWGRMEAMVAALRAPLRLRPVVEALEGVKVLVYFGDSPVVASRQRGDWLLMWNTMAPLSEARGWVPLPEVTDDR